MGTGTGSSCSRRRDEGRQVPVEWPVPFREAAEAHRPRRWRCFFCSSREASARQSGPALQPHRVEERSPTPRDHSPLAMGKPPLREGVTSPPRGGSFPSRLSPRDNALGPLPPRVEERSPTRWDHFPLAMGKSPLHERTASPCTGTASTMRWRSEPTSQRPWSHRVGEVMLTFGDRFLSRMAREENFSFPAIPPRCEQSTRNRPPLAKNGRSRTPWIYEDHEDGAMVLRASAASP